MIENSLIYETSESTDLIAQSAKDFALKFIKPHVMEWDESQHFPIDVMRKAGALGFLGILIPEEYGGSGLGYHEYISVIEQISIVDPSIGLSVAAHNSLCTNHIYLFGNETQRAKWLPKLVTGEHIGAWGLTEHNTGSDAKGNEYYCKESWGIIGS
jgi:alkylation response protein AidB-like acyl-CoA dehydrogenase